MKKTILLISIFCIAIFVNAQKNTITQKTNNLPDPSKTFKQKPVTQKQGSIIRPVSTGKKEYKVEKKDYSYYYKFDSLSEVKVADFFQKMNIEAGMKTTEEYKLSNSQKDELGYTHYNYYQYYQGIRVMGGQMLLHEINGMLKSANGNYYDNLNINITPALTRKEAFKRAMNYYNLPDSTINDTSLYVNAKLIIAPVNGIYTKENFRLCYKYTITTTKPYGIWETYIEAHTGELINKISLIADATGTANTLYSGTVSVETEYSGGSYRLHDVGRNIETYDMHNGTNYGAASYFTDNDNNWIEQLPTLSLVTINNVSSSWWYSTISDELPDLYIVIKDASNTIVYSSSYVNNTNPPISFTVGLALSNPPYNMEIWDYDAVGSNDFGGNYSIVISNGTHAFSASGNNGSYVVDVQNNPALDVHWGMEKTYDYYLTKHSRNSFDNSHGAIKSYVHKDYLWDNANWNGSVMNFGDGDGIAMSSLVCLDVSGHEFTHAVTSNNGNGGLTYQGESGALNESFSDIFGTAIEFYAKPSVANWLIGEDIMLQEPFMRSMSNPNSASQQQPDTYWGDYWYSGTGDFGGVHCNSGVMNYWFYLLCQGGSGTNDIGNPFSITGIGISKAEKIAYKNLTTYITANATYYDAMQGSLQAAEDLYGAGTTEYFAVKDAWYAVGLGNTSNNVYCSGTTTLTEPAGTFDDGSGSANYMNNSSCEWLIQPTGADYITIDFTSFDTETNYDSVVVYNGPTDASPRLMSWWGNTIPPQISSTVGAMLVKLYTDGSNTAAGFEASYQAYGVYYCDGATLFSDASGSFEDGSGVDNYGNNSECYWIIAPPGATSITLSFASFDTEQDYDGVIIYDGLDTTSNQIAVYTGASLPGSVTSYTGEMLVYFISDFMNVAGGWDAYYTSTGAPYCNGTTLFTDDYASFEDGSGANNYYNNTNCSWLIQPTGATSVTLHFTSFDLEQPNGQSIYDAVDVYNGTDYNAPLLGSYTGNNLPPAITSSGGAMYLEFHSDFSNRAAGWNAYYTSTTNNFCSGNTVLTSTSGSLSDGSGANLYGNNSDCRWLIQPTGATSITLSFSSFDTEQDYDGIIVYDGSDTSATQLGVFTGNTLPPNITSTGGSMLVWFLSDEIVRGNGWSANYTSTTIGVLNVTTSAMPSTICSGSSTQLNANASGGNGTYTYAWSSNPTGFTSSSQNPTVTPITGTTYTVTVTSGANTATSSVLVTVNPIPIQPTISAIGNQLRSSAASGNQWYYNSSIINGATSQTYTATQDGSYYVIVTNGYGCSNTSSVFIYTAPTTQPFAPEVFATAGDYFVNGNVALEWSIGECIIETATGTNNIMTQGFHQSNYLITLLNETSGDDYTINVYPNPTSDNIIVDIISKQEGGVKLRLYDVSGKLLINQKMKSDEKTKILNLQKFVKGTYILSIYTDSGKPIKTYKIEKNN